MPITAVVFGTSLEEVSEQLLYHLTNGRMLCRELM